MKLHGLISWFKQYRVIACVCKYERARNDKIVEKLILGVPWWLGPENFYMPPVRPKKPKKAHFGYYYFILPSTVVIL